jgi:cytochrome c peroxidase
MSRQVSSAWRAAAIAWVVGSAAAAAGATDFRLEPLPPPAQVNAALADLGRHLFFETRLSGDGSRSCATCHVPANGFADGQALSRGYNGTEHFRNAPGLLSVRLKPRLMWDGRHAGGDLAVVVREMITDGQFMNGDTRIIEERIRQMPPLLALWRRAFGERSEPRGEQVFQAIAEYLGTLDFATTAVDRMLRGDSTALPPLAAAGLQLFSGKAGCVDCHHGPLLSDGKPHRLGVADHPALAREPLRTITLLRHNAVMGVPNAMAERGDVGVYAVSGKPADRGRFITPGLRGLIHSGPYMHNGRYASLEQVVDFHDRGGGSGSELRPLNLGARERQALVAFLRSLSSPPQRVEEPPAYDYGTIDRARR